MAKKNRKSKDSMQNETPGQVNHNSFSNLVTGLADNDGDGRMDTAKQHNNKSKAKNLNPSRKG